LNEFDIIQKYFSRLTQPRNDVVVGIGDDCALLIPDAGKLLAVSTDTLVAGRHFLADVDPEALGHKSLAVNLSDLAAMGAEPCWVSLALTLPGVNEYWLEKFSQGFAALAQKHHLQLIGGDITKGPLSITITVHGQVEPEKALHRSGAKAGNLVCVTGKLGEASLALKNILENDFVADQLRNELEWPQPRVEIGLALQGLATACIDVSDGLVSDLGHICAASDCKAIIKKNAIPAPDADMTQKQYIQTVLSGGDDYELCFTLPAERENELQRIITNTGIPITPIGYITDGRGIEIVDSSGAVLDLSDHTGYMHFS
jgi:thiamine-monophosphate kinase